jgi:hypothetical protein
MVAYRLLAVHGHRAYEKEGVIALTPQNLAVCRHVAEISQNYDFHGLLGGWHDKSLLPTETNAVVMSRELIRLGVPAGKIKIPYDHCTFVHHMPARETAEEGKLLAAYLEASRRNGDWEYEVTAITAREWVPRIRRIYAALGIKPVEIIAVNAPTPLRFRLIEFGLRLLSMVDPLGIGTITGIPQRFIRRSRTLARGPTLKPLLE